MVGAVTAKLREPKHVYGHEVRTANLSRTNANYETERLYIAANTNDNRKY